MNLQPVNPPLRDGQQVICCRCHTWSLQAVADLDDEPGTFYCHPCAWLMDRAANVEQQDKRRA